MTTLVKVTAPTLDGDATLLTPEALDFLGILLALGLDKIAICPKICYFWWDWVITGSQPPTMRQHH